MSFLADVRAVVSVHEAELRRDLDQARYELRRARTAAAELERRVAALEEFLALGSLEGTTSDAPVLTLHEAMVTVLEMEPTRMLRAGDLAAEINRHALYRMRDGRPVEAQQIHARVGQYPHLFGKAGTFIRLLKGLP